MLLVDQVLQRRFWSGLLCLQPFEAESPGIPRASANDYPRPLPRRIFGVLCFFEAPEFRRRVRLCHGPPHATLAQPPTPSFQNCGSAPSPRLNAYDKLLDYGENPSRVQRHGRRLGAGAVVGKDVGETSGACAYRTLVEELSMTGAQFLDLVVRRMAQYI